jgi:hypothetical protein
MTSVLSHTPASPVALEERAGAFILRELEDGELRVSIDHGISELDNASQTGVASLDDLPQHREVLELQGITRVESVEFRHEFLKERETSLVGVLFNLGVGRKDQSSGS